MELREYYKIWREHISVVIYAVLLLLVVAYAWSVKKSETYSASLLLEISRSENQTTAEYQYDQFYRLQADEKFAEIIVSWLKSPGVANDVFEKSGVGAGQRTMRQLSKSFRAEKASSGNVGVSFESQTNEEAKKIADAISQEISGKTRNLNSETRDPNWFTVDMANLVITKNIQDLRINLGSAVLAGIFIGTILAFGKHYISEET